MKQLVTIPNALTMVRLLGAVCLLALTPLSPAFYVVYAVAGVSDALDGFAARRLHCVSEGGARLDSVADLCFYGVTIVRLFPVLWRALPVWMLFLVALVLLIRLASYVTAAVKFHTFSSLHTYLNKATGLLLFFLPVAIRFPFFLVYSAIACLAGILSSSEELILHLSCRKYPADCRGLAFQTVALTHPKSPTDGAI